MKKLIATVATAAALVATQVPAFAQQTQAPNVTIVKPDPNTARAADGAAKAADTAAKSADAAATQANKAAARADTPKAVVVNTTRAMPIDPASVMTTVPQGSFTTAELMKHAVKTQAGDDIANIDEFVFTPDGRIEYVVLGFGGFLGIGEKDVMLPWSDFQIDHDNKLLTANLTKDQVEKLPEMARN